ncbi:hypothetical protein NP493_132g00048 [Ridgeia piscesae]|uniref:Uncharacterized protein n=1 Tax=Ridgeia piscesae TaxID=27915 RepID=A0AAD9P5C2_RIDPI|nr:hypothetical protein NP493_132g00048 [Ridgeia piscesae]
MDQVVAEVKRRSPRSRVKQAATRRRRTANVPYRRAAATASAQPDSASVSRGSVARPTVARTTNVASRWRHCPTSLRVTSNEKWPMSCAAIDDNVVLL